MAPGASVSGARFSPLLAVTAFALGITTPPRSGPYCTGNCIVYPFTDAARFVPRDYSWVIPAIFLVPVFVVVVASIHECVQPGKRHLNLVGLCFFDRGFDHRD